MIPSRFVDDPLGQHTSEFAIVKSLLDGDDGLGLPCGPIRDDLGGSAHHAIYVGADQDCAGREQAQAMGVERAAAGTGNQFGSSRRSRCA